MKELFVLDQELREEGKVKREGKGEKIVRRKFPRYERETAERTTYQLQRF